MALGVFVFARSPKRAAAAPKTRQAIRDAAEQLFLRDGYARTSMKAIAKQAGVSEPSMYLIYTNKANLLREVVQVAVRGDEAPATLSQRAAWRAVMAGPLDEVFERFAALNAALMTRTAQIIALAPGISEQDAADIMYALVTDVTIYLRLTTECGWNETRYADLIAHTLKANLTAA